MNLAIGVAAVIALALAIAVIGYLRTTAHTFSPPRLSVHMTAPPGFPVGTFRPMLGHFAQPIGYLKNGTPIMPMAGGDPNTAAAEFAEEAKAAFAQIQSILPELERAKDEDTARFDALKAKVEELGTEVSAAKAKEAAALREVEHASLLERVTTIESSLRNPSKAAIISGKVDDIVVDTDHFFRYLALAQNPKNPAHIRDQAEKALIDMGTQWEGVPDWSKATLGDTNAAGGYIAPRAVVAAFTEVAVAENPYRSLLTVITDVIGPTIEVPHIGLQPTRATVVARGVTKTNVGVDLANYTATFYTLAQIHDAGNQWLRQTKGRGEQLIRARLGKAMGLGEAYYVLQGSGTNEPKGILTSIGTSGTFVTSHTASNATVAGSAATAIAKAAGALANRSRTPDGVVMNAGDFWIMLAQGSDTAGFWVAPAAGPASVNAAGFQNGQPALRMWNSNLGIFPDPNMPADSLVVGEWSSAELYVGDGYRVDTSTEAGDRWDKNLTGFRAEEEIAFNADPYVAAGLFQRIIDAVA